jgi:hypothetical protein
VTTTFWLALPFYLAVGVILWRAFPTLRHVFCEAGDFGGMLIFAVLWPLLLVQFAFIMTIAGVFALFGKLFGRK